MWRMTTFGLFADSVGLQIIIALAGMLWGLGIGSGVAILGTFLVRPDVSDSAKRDADRAMTGRSVIIRVSVRSSGNSEPNLIIHSVRPLDRAVWFWEKRLFRFGRSCRTFVTRGKHRDEEIRVARREAQDDMDTEIPGIVFAW